MDYNSQISCVITGGESLSFHVSAQGGDETNQPGKGLEKTTTGTSHMHDVWHSAPTENSRAVAAGLWGDTGRNMSLMSQVWLWWETNGYFSSHRCDRQPSAGISPSVGRCLWENVVAPGPRQGGGVWARTAPSEDAAQLRAQLYGGTQGGRSHLHHPSVQQLGHVQWCPGAWQ